jgi:cystathionine beta-lyase/cystathionine gamma-synthase
MTHASIGTKKAVGITDDLVSLSVGVRGYRRFISDLNKL